MQDAWRLMWEGLGYVNSAIMDLQDLDYKKVDMTQQEVEAVLAELHVFKSISLYEDYGIMG